MRGAAGISICWPILTNEHFKDALEKAADGSSPNNISPIIRYSHAEGASVMWMGDLETDFMEKIKIRHHPRGLARLVRTPSRP